MVTGYIDCECGSGPVYNFSFSKMDRLGELEYLSVIKFLLLENSNKQIWVHKYLASRSENGEFERSYPYEELRENYQKFFEYKIKRTRCVFVVKHC